MSIVRTSQGKRKLAVESALFGLGYTAVLVWVGSALVGSFGYDIDSFPYWPAIPHLRTDTAGFLAFALAIVTLVPSKYLQLRRRNGAPAQPVALFRPPACSGYRPWPKRPRSSAPALSSTCRLTPSCTHGRCEIQLTHLLPWPSEGTVRVIALAICLVAVAASRYLRATATRARPGRRG